MEPRWYIEIVATVKEIFSNRARVKAEQELATIRAKVDM